MAVLVVASRLGMRSWRASGTRRRHGEISRFSSQTRGAHQLSVSQREPRQQRNPSETEGIAEYYRRIADGLQTAHLLFLPPICNGCKEMERRKRRCFGQLETKKKNFPTLATLGGPPVDMPVPSITMVLNPGSPASFPPGPLGPPNVRKRTIGIHGPLLKEKNQN